MASRAVFFQQRLDVLREVRRAAREPGRAQHQTNDSHKNFVIPGFGSGDGVKLPLQSIAAGPSRSCEFSA